MKKTTNFLQTFQEIELFNANLIDRSKNKIDQPPLVTLRPRDLVMSPPGRRGFLFSQKWSSSAGRNAPKKTWIKCQLALILEMDFPPFPPRRPYSFLFLLFGYVRVVAVSRSEFKFDRSVSGFQAQSQWRFLFCKRYFFGTYISHIPTFQKKCLTI